MVFIILIMNGLSNLFGGRWSSNNEGDHKADIVVA